MNNDLIATINDSDGTKTNAKFTFVDSLESIKKMIDSDNVQETQLFYIQGESNLYMYNNSKLDILVAEPNKTLWEIQSGKYARKILGSDFGQVIPYTEKENDQNGL